MAFSHGLFYLDVDLFNVLKITGFESLYCMLGEGGGGVAD